MTNRNMVKTGGATPSGAPRPEPNIAKPPLMPATESDRALYTDQEPLDSPQPKPMIRQRKTNGLRADPSTPGEQSPGDPDTDRRGTTGTCES